MLQPLSKQNEIVVQWTQLRCMLLDLILLIELRINKHLFTAGLRHIRNGSLKATRLVAQRNPFNLKASLVRFSLGKQMTMMMRVKTKQRTLIQVPSQLQEMMTPITESDTGFRKTSVTYAKRSSVLINENAQVDKMRVLFLLQHFPFQCVH